MSDSKDNSMIYEVRFVILHDKNHEEGTEIMKAAFEAMEFNGLDPLWITEDECLQFKEKPSKLFIFDPFEGEAYQHLTSLQCRVLGPLCILTCLQASQSLPNRAYPVYSLAMRGITVTCSNVEKTVREDVCQKIQFMGGLFSRNLTKSVTHLIAGTVGSDKYQVATNFALPVMTIDWVYTCWNEGQYQQTHANDVIYNKYRCPPFKGLNITISQYDNKERQKVQQLVEKNGGMYSGAMKSKVTTHLILAEPKGEKYKFARAWNIKCVKLAWLYDSANAGFCKSETDYQLDEKVDQSHLTSTPERNSLAEKLKNLRNFSMISNISAVSCPESRVEETVNVDLTVTPVNTKNDFSIDFLDEFSDFSKVGQFFDGCRIFISGFNRIRLEKLYKIINAGGGMRFNKLSENITHIILGDKDDKILKSVLENSIKCHIVSYLWLLNSYKENKMLDEQPYKYIDNVTLSPQIHKSNSEIKECSNLKKSKENNTEVNCLEGEVHSKDEHNFCDVTDQYGQKNKLQSSTVINDNITEVHTKQEESNNKNGKLFSGLSAVINGFAAKDTAVLKEMFESNGGELSDSATDLCIVPLTGPITNKNVRNVVTNYWLQMCIEQEEVLGFGADRLFKPMSISCQALKDCVISFSQFVGIERDGLIHLAEELGATCQDYFVRKSNKSHGLLANTHLITAVAEGSKYEAAKKWNIPAVTKDWLFAIVEKGKCVNEKDYLIDLQNCTLAYDRILDTIHSDEPKENISNTEKKNNVDVELSTRTLPLLADTMLLTNDVQHKQIQILRNETNNRESMGKCESTPSKFLNPDEIYQPNYEVNNSLLAMLEVPDKSNERKKSLAIQDLYAKNISIALKNIGANEDSLNESKKSEENSTENINIDTAKPLKNVILCVSKKLSSKQAELNNIIVNLGGDFRWSYSSLCTHFVYQGKHTISSRDLKLAQEQGKKIVCPEWVYACRDSMAHVDENLYPHTYNRKFSLIGQISAKKIVSPKLNEDERNKTDGSEVKQNDYKNELTAVDLDTPVKDKGVNEISKELEELFNASKRKVDDVECINTTSPNAKSSVFVENVYNQSAQKKVSKLQLVENNASKNVKEKVKIPVEQMPPIPIPTETYTQSVPIMWDDPTARIEREKLAEHVNQAALNTDSSNSAKVMKGQAADAVSLKKHNLNISTNAVDHTDKMQVELSKIKKHKFMFSGLSESEKKQYSKIIKNLGGDVSDIKIFDNTATHLILGQPLKNEKYLASVAAGLWVLHKTYIEACEKANEFVEEDFHEWGGPITHTIEENLPNKLNKVALCPYRWRICIQEKSKNQPDRKCGAFSDWKVMIFSSKQKSLTYKRILESGRAEIVGMQKNFDHCDATHAFIELSKEELKKLNLETLVSSGVSCLKPEYLAFYLVEPVPPPIEKFLIPEVAELIGINKKKRNSESSVSNSKRHQCDR